MGDAPGQDRNRASNASTTQGEQSTANANRMHVRRGGFSKPRSVREI